jgi:signal transduction histidine kinase
MRNPMGAIKGFIEFLLKEIPGPLNEAQKKMLLSMDRAAFRLLGMINNILDIAKMEAGKMILNLSEFNIVEVARRSIELMESLTQKKNISMELIAPQELKLNADMALIERIFINLIGNAIKFTGENGKIMVGLEKKDKYIYGWVEDTGEGLPLDYVEKVFEKFEQVKGQKAGGTGLGLTICKYITKTHLGDIWAEQYPKRGARFVFKIPLGLTKNEDGGIYIDESKIV